MIEIGAIGGYSEFGRNMTAVKVDDEIIIIDMGIHLENYIRLQGDEDIEFVGIKRLLEAKAIPDFRVIDPWKKKVKAIIPTHAHLDHVGAIPYISNKFPNAEILCTPFTGEVIKAITNDKRKRLKNKLKMIHSNSTYKVSDNITLDFIHVTHSTPQTIMLAVHTKYGTLLYANDFKFDSSPTLGAKPNFEKLKSLTDVKGLIVDCTRAQEAMKTPSESVAREMLKDVMMGTNSDGKIIIATTFSSHLARLKSIIEFGKQKKRKIVMLGRSLAKYVEAGHKAGIINFKDVEIIKQRDKVKAKLRKIEKDKSKYLLIVTGHQGEPEAILSRMAYGDLEFNFEYEDHIIFSCSIIPNEQNIADRKKLEKELRHKRVRIFTDIHAGGHAAREDIRDLINMVNPDHLIPAHGDPEMMLAFKELSEEMGYKRKKVHLMHNGDFLKL